MGEEVEKRMAQVRGVVRCQCGWYIGRNIIRNEGKCRVCDTPLEDK